MDTKPISATHRNYTLREIVVYFLKLGTIGFGGPVALVGYMNRDLVENRKWITEEGYKEGLALAQLAPGPLAAQLSIYLGFVHYRIPGATLCGIAFVLPSFCMVVALGILYQQFGGLPWMQAVFCSFNEDETWFSFSCSDLISQSCCCSFVLISVCLNSGTDNCTPAP